jgi:pyrophosphatase PpaX
LEVGDLKGFQPSFLWSGILEQSRNSASRPITVILMVNDTHNYSQIPIFTAFTEYKAIFFDLDGVFVNSNNAWVIALQKVLEVENLKPIPTEEIEKYLALSTKRQIEHFFPEFAKNSQKIENLVLKVDYYYRDHIAEYVKLNEGSHKLLSILHKKFKLALITNNRREVTDAVLDYFDLRKYFHTVIHLDIMDQPKPHPGAIFEALSQLKVDKRSIVFIGDSPSDLETSLRARVQFILIKSEASTFIFPDIPQNVRIVSNVNDLIAFCR